MTSLLRDPRCSCDLVATLGAAVEGQPAELCDVHDADRIAERLQSEIEARMARTEMIADKVAGQPASSDTQQESHMALNSVAIEQSVADALGATVHTPSH